VNNEILFFPLLAANAELKNLR